MGLGFPSGGTKCSKIDCGGSQTNMWLYLYIGLYTMNGTVWKSCLNEIKLSSNPLGKWQSYKKTELQKLAVQSVPSIPPCATDKSKLTYRS